MSETEEAPWFRRWFGEEYLELYPHRDEAEAVRGIRLFGEAAALPPRSRVLDLACGAGRHLRALREQGLRAVGLDLSLPLLRRARADLRPGGPPAVTRGDMRRLPFRGGAFDGTVLFFTSFGYFEEPGDDRQVLEELARVLRPGGAYLLDTLNPSHVRATLVPEDEREIGGRTVRQRRRIREGRVEKRIEIEPRHGEGETRVYRERVRMYDPDELGGLLRRVGLPPGDLYGDYGGGKHGPDSPRLILAGRRG